MKIQNHAKTDFLDAGGATASLLCAVHCAFMPAVVTLLPLIGLGFLATEAAEVWLVVLSALLGISSLCLGYRQHRSRRALGLLAIGVGMLAAGHIAEHHEISTFGIPLVVTGGLVVAASHGFNYWLCRRCRSCQNPEAAARNGLVSRGAQ